MRSLNSIIFGITISTTSLAQAAFQLKPGLWEVQTTTSVNGKQINAGQKLNESMQKMSPAQRKQMEKMMGSKGLNFGENGVRVCHAKSTIAEKLIQDPKSDCQIKDKKELADGIKFNIQCKNGNGTAEYHRTSDTSYKGFNEFQTPEGKSRTEFTGKFLASDCGDVKPL